MIAFAGTQDLIVHEVTELTADVLVGQRCRADHVHATLLDDVGRGRHQSVAVCVFAGRLVAPGQRIGHRANDLQLGVGKTQVDGLRDDRMYAGLRGKKHGEQDDLVGLAH
ncbi:MULTISPECIES: hypothetical protein [Rhizobium]|uniref:Uncharacterized protein n=1 Tax=Rhizobium leguminosarum TaxID=384 RepID=A0A1B1CN89_RHILE|nr:hypothetical protein [Rhizobium leguminosarum]ANP91224.1 hypothetical protein BA011_35880 [Rhizobium leguminosarum]